jgi:hypothetical protein
MAPKFSFALKDLTEFLGIFELTEEELRSRKEYSETSSNVSYVTQSAFKHKQPLDIIDENDAKVEGESEQTHTEDEKSVEEEEEESEGEESGDIELVEID